jgi:hypothetical protein
MQMLMNTFVSKLLIMFSILSPDAMLKIDAAESSEKLILFEAFKILVFITIEGSGVMTTPWSLESTALWLEHNSNSLPGKTIFSTASPAAGEYLMEYSFLVIIAK